MSLSTRLLLASVGLVIVGRFGLFQFARGAAVKFSTQVERGALVLSGFLKREASFWFKLGDFRERHFLLEKRVSELEGQLSLRKEVEQENRELRIQLGSQLARRGHSFLMARVVGVGEEGVSYALIVDQGSNQGVKENVVVVAGNFLVGIVEKAGPERSLVKLLTNPAFEAAALDQDSPQRAQGIIRGKFGTHLLMEKILPSEEVVVGDTIITSGTKGSFPPGLIIGKVSRVVGGEADALKSAEIETLLDPLRLERVFILSGGE